jgi:RNA polymerase sigma factor (sigma-70 family)
MISEKEVNNSNDGVIGMVISAKHDLEAREEIVKQFTPFVQRMIKDLVSFRSSDYDDLLVEGQMGILEAIDGFDPNKGAQFMTYAFYKIRNRLNKFLIKSNLVTASTFKNTPDVLLVHEQTRNDNDNQQQQFTFAGYNDLSFNEEDFLLDEHKKELIEEALEELNNPKKQEIVRYLFGLGRPVKSTQWCATVFNFSINYINMIKKDFIDTLRDIVEEDEMEEER